LKFNCDCSAFVIHNKNQKQKQKQKPNTNTKYQNPTSTCIALQNEKSKIKTALLPVAQHPVSSMQGEACRRSVSASNFSNPNFKLWTAAYTAYCILCDSAAVHLPFMLVRVVLETWI
jgi:hypothetical protein